MRGYWLNADPAGIAGGLNLYEYAGNNPINNIDPKGLTIEYANHPAVPGSPWSHSLLIIIPDNQAAYAKDPNYQNINGQGQRYATIGAGTDSIWGFGGTLIAGIDRPRDVNVPPENIRVLPLPSQYSNEDQAIQALVALTNTYNSSPEAYTLFPQAWTGEYNSNSFISGLISAAGYDWFGDTGANTPGWYPNWVPNSDFIRASSPNSSKCP